ncbi:MAG: DNA mismatch repair endonuclease MutL [Pyrinomonadaceae bacterium]
MSKIRVLTDHLANQIAAGEVVERPASVAKELVENAIDAGARRLGIDVEAGGRRLLRITDDGEGMTRDDAVLAFERHATSKISRTEDLARISTLGFRGEALASIASVARVELITNTDERTAATRVLIEGGRMRDVKDAAHPRGTTVGVRDLFFNVPARRKFLRSEATESFHLSNLVTHYALAHPEIAFTLTNNGREILRAAEAADLRERAYQIFGEGFLENLLDVGGGYERVARVRGYVSAPRERRSSRDAQYIFVNGRFVRDRLIGRALAEGYRAVLPPGTFPVALLFLEVPLEEVDVNVHPAKTEVRFRRASAVADTVRDAVRQTLAGAGYARLSSVSLEAPERADESAAGREQNETHTGAIHSAPIITQVLETPAPSFLPSRMPMRDELTPPAPASPQQSRIAFGSPAPPSVDAFMREEISSTPLQSDSLISDAQEPLMEREARDSESVDVEDLNDNAQASALIDSVASGVAGALPPLASAASLVREVSLKSISGHIRPLGQLAESFIIATDDEGLLLIDQHIAHERILYDEYLARENQRTVESQHLLVPETFDLTPAQTSVFDALGDELEKYGFNLMRLSGRTIAVKAVPVDLPQGDARNLLAEILETMDANKRRNTRASLRERITASLACHAAVKAGTTLAPEKMRWLIDRLLTTSSPTTCPHGRPVVLRLATRDILRGFHKS